MSAPPKLATTVGFPLAFAERTVTKLAGDNSETSVAERYQLRARRASRSPKTSVPNIRANAKLAFRVHTRSHRKSDALQGQ